MMRGRRHYAVAVRSPHGGIIVDQGELTSPIYTSPVFRWPFLRGLQVLVEQFHLGSRALAWSARVLAGEQDIELSGITVGISMGFAMLIGLGLFFGLPLALAGFSTHSNTSVAFVLVESLLRLALVLGYLYVISLLPDVKRLFQYHGAEHKTINAFEHGLPLTPAGASAASRLHPRCGTGFLVVVLVVSLLLFGGLAALHPPVWVTVLSRVVGIPVIASVSFEAIRLMARHQSSPGVRLLLQPVLATQLLTTREPTLEQLEVAIASFATVRASEAGPPAQVEVALA